MNVEAFSMEPKAAVEFFRQKGLKTTFSWQDMLHEEHSRNFTVAKMLDMALLKDVHDAVDEAVSKGMTLHQFRERLEPILQEKGWWGRKEMVDPATGEVVEVQLGSSRRLRTIFETNMKTAYAAGHWDQIKATADVLPYLQYSAVDDDKTRDEHKAWDNLILRWDDPWWKTHFPPNGWNCRCSVIQMTERMMKEAGKDKPDQAPAGGSYVWINPRTGEEMQIPDGIDPGWAYNPGEGRNSDAVETLLERIAEVPPAIGAEVWESLTEEVKDLAAELFAEWADEVLESGKQEGRIQPVGVIDPTVMSGVEDAGVELETSLITVSDRVLLHMNREAKLQTKKDVGVDRIKELPQIIDRCENVLFDLQDPALLYLFELDDEDLIGKFVVRVNVQTKMKKPAGKVKVTTNSVVSGGKVKIADVSGKRYRLVKGKL